MDNLFVTESEVLSLANTVLAEADLNKVLSTTSQINSFIFSQLFNKLPQVSTTLIPLGTNEGIRCQTIINSLKKLLPPQISLTHIKGHDLAKGNLMAVKNLLEIFGLLLNLPCMETSTDDSNVISGKGLDVINEVLKEEFTSPCVHIPTGSTVTPPTSHTSPLYQSTPHQSTKSRLAAGNVLDIPSLSISTVSSTITGDKDNTSDKQSYVIPDKREFSSNDREVETELSEGEHNVSISEMYEEKNSLDNDKESVKDTTVSAEEGDQDIELDDKTHKKEILHTICNNYLKIRGHNKTKKPDKRQPRGKQEGLHRGCTSQDDTHLLIKTIKKSFPEIYLSPATERQLSCRPKLDQIKTTNQLNPAERKIEEIQIRQKAFLNVLQKELKHNQKMKQQEKAVQLALQNQRHVTAKSRRYFNEYELAIRSKLQKKRTKEEQVFKEAFEQCLQLLRDNKRELVQYTKEKQQLATQRHQEHLESLQTFYHDQLAMVAEAIDKDQKETILKEKDQEKVTREKKHELRKMMESGIQELWSGLNDWEETNVHFRKCDRELLQSSYSKGLKKGKIYHTALS